MVLDLTPNYLGSATWFVDVDDTIEKVKVQNAPCPLFGPCMALIDRINVIKLHLRLLRCSFSLPGCRRILAEFGC